MKDMILGGDLRHGKTRLRKIDALLRRIDRMLVEYPQLSRSLFRDSVWEARELEAARVGTKCKHKFVGSKVCLLCGWRPRG